MKELNLENVNIQNSKEYEIKYHENISTKNMDINDTRRR